MLTTLIAVVVVVAIPVVLVLGALALLGSLVAALADGLPNGLVRPNPS